MTRTHLGCCAALALLLACGEGPTPERVWTPADHVQPPSRQVDPARIPQRAPEALSPEEQRLRAARALWSVSCASCHGADGSGGPEAPGPVPNFQDAAWQTSRTDAQLALSIRNGRGMMPAFDNVDEAGLAALVGLVRAFAPPPPPPPAAE